MLVSYKWLNSFFDGTLPSPQEVGEKLTFHAWEIESVEEKGNDAIIDVNVLPDTSSWALSHRGVAKNLSVILNTKLARDPLGTPAQLASVSDRISIRIDDPDCLRYSAAQIDGVKVGPSPDWLRTYLEAIGQKSINNIVDAANYVMLDMGQPLHVFDSNKLSGSEKSEIVVRKAKEGESITTLTGDSYELSEENLLIVDGGTDAAIGIAGVKGGKEAEVTDATVNILIESANFNGVSIRKTSRQLKLRTDASTRYENGILPDLTSYGLREIVVLICEIAGGVCVGYADAYKEKRTLIPVSVELRQINSLLGVDLSIGDITGILDRFGYAYEISGDSITVTPPIERDDLHIAEDLIEEIGRIYGYEHVDSIVPEKVDPAEVNARSHYADAVRRVLVARGFSEILTSSFRERDEVKLANALASDKGYLRSSLRENMREALERNRVNADLLGLTQIRMFEIGTVFTKDREYMSCAFGVWSPRGHTPKQDDPLLDEVKGLLSETLAISVDSVVCKDGIVEFDLDALITDLPIPATYAPFEKSEDITYQPFSPYPFVSRDIAFWTPKGTLPDTAEALLNEHAGSLRERTTLFDTFEKDERTSYAFRLVFQSDEKTLTDQEVNMVMDGITKAVKEAGWEVR